MAAYLAGLAKHTNKQNSLGPVYVEYVVKTQPILSTDTFKCVIPAHIDPDLCPVAAIAYTRAVTGVLTAIPVVITSHQGPADSGQTETLPLGTTVITPSATLAIDAIVIVEYTPYKFGLTTLGSGG